MSVPLLPLIGLGLTVGGSFLQAGMAASMANAQAQVANQQLKVDMENERIKGMQEANARQEEYLRNEGSNRAAVAASGTGRNISFEQGLGPYNKKVAARDIQTIGFNTGQKVARMGYEIRVNRANARNAATSAYVGAAADSIGAVGGYLVSNPSGLLRSRNPSQV